MTEVERRQGWYAVLCLHVTWLLWAGIIKSLGVMLPTFMEQFYRSDMADWMDHSYSNCIHRVYR